MKTYQLRYKSILLQDEKLVFVSVLLTDAFGVADAAVCVIVVLTVSSSLPVPKPVVCYDSSH